MNISQIKQEAETAFQKEKEGNINFWQTGIDEEIAYWKEVWIKGAVSAHNKAVQEAIRSLGLLENDRGQPLFDIDQAVEIKETLEQLLIPE